MIDSLRSWDDRTVMVSDSLCLSNPSCLFWGRLVERTSILQRGHMGWALFVTTVVKGAYRIHSSIHGRWKIWWHAFNLLGTESNEKYHQIRWIFQSFQANRAAVVQGYIISWSYLHRNFNGFARYILLSNVCVVCVKCIYGNFSRECCCRSGTPSILSHSANSTSFGAFGDIECMRPLHTRLIEWWDTWQRRPKYLVVKCKLELHSTVMIIAVNIGANKKIE